MSNPELDDVFMEATHVTSELAHEEPSRALFAAWQNSAVDQRAPAADRAQQIQQLRDAADNASAGRHDELAREQLAQSSEIMEYLWFGNDGTPLPKALRRYALPDDETPVLALNPHILSPYNFGIALELLQRSGLQRLVTARQRRYEAQADFIFSPLAYGVAANTPGYRLLESFNAPQHLWEERPLTTTERLIEEQAAEYAVRKRHGLADREPMSGHPNARAELGRMVHRLDEATRYDRRKLPQKPPRKRACEFFSQLVAREVVRDRGVAGSHLEGIQTVAYESAVNKRPRLLEVTTELSSFHTFGESVDTFAVSQGYLTVPSLRRLRYISSGLVGDMALDLFDKDQADRDYTSMLDDLLEEYTQELVADMGKLAAGAYVHGRFESLVTLLTMPTEADETLPSPVMAAPELSSLSPETVVSRSEYRQAQREIWGYIRKRPAEDTDVRVIQYRPLDDTLPSASEDVDLTLHLPELNPDLVPYVPGYELTSYDATRKLFGLRYVAEADPYSECTTRIPVEAQAWLATTYADIGLKELALLVHDASELTVGRLVRLIAETNRYILPHESTPIEVPDTLEDYAKQVKAGRLGMQCVGMSHFPRLTLEAIFGEGAAGVIAGDTLPRDGRRITAVGHQQTTFTDPETSQLYILDATPASFHLALWRDMLRQQIGSLRRYMGLRTRTTDERTAPIRPEPQTIPLPEQMSEETIAAYRHELIVQTKDALVLQLRMLYGKEGQPLPQDQMYKVVVGLPADDLIFRSLSAAHLAARGQLEQEEAARLMRYIQALRNCDDSRLLQRVDPRRYAARPRLMHALQSHIGQLQHLTNL